MKPELQPVVSYGHLSPEILLRLFEEPELADTDWIRANMATRQADMWALGTILFTILAGYQPFEEDQLIAVLLRIFKTCGTPGMDMEHTDYPSLFHRFDYLVYTACHFPLWYSSAA